MIGGFLLLALLGSALVAGWFGATTATRAMPAPDLRSRPSNEAITAAASLLRISLPATDTEIKTASRKLYPRCPGDFFEDGTRRFDLLNDIMAAADLLIALNAFDANPPYEARHLLAYWRYRAGLLGTLWSQIAPPPVVRRLRLQVQHEVS